MSWQILHGDCLQLLPTLDADSFDSCVTDPPYELGFMSRKWDSSGIAFSIDVWQQVYRVLKPGAHLVCFGGTRTFHRIATAIEDAGFELRDSVAWLYASGMPKSLNVAKAIDGYLGIAPTVIGQSQNWGAATHAEGRTTYADFPGAWDITQPTSDQAKQWAGWGTGLKPCFEPILIARKPIKEKTIARNVLAHGCGALNIDATRIPHESAEDYAKHAAQVQAIKARGGTQQGSWKNSSDLAGANDASALGRWTPNVCIDEHTAEALQAHSKYFYVAKPSKSERQGNPHPTPKPIKLLTQLVQLVTRPSGKVLDPFAGSGSTGVAAVRAGFEFTGIELNDTEQEPYVTVAKQRLTQAEGSAGE